MGNPVYPTCEEIQKLRKAAELPAPERPLLTEGKITLTLPPYGLALREIR